SVEESKTNESADEKVSNSSVVVVAAVQSTDEEDEDENPKDGQDGSNLSVLSLVCSEMLDKSHDPSKQKGKKTMEKQPKINKEPSKDVSSPKGSNDSVTPNNEKAINGNSETCGTVSSPLVFSIPANSYPVAPTQVVPIKRETTLNGASTSTDFKRAKHSLINDAGQGQFQLEQTSFSQQQ
ncbi:450_t:CDS:1, partial [Scutellospora calospora]